MDNVVSLEKNNYEVIGNDELMDIDGGLVITGSMVVAGVGILAGGVAVGYAAGTVVENWLD
ncbi:Blp family class II bacteriocin [Virgibacillus xinjiangensis]|uniref:Blp family class II bacteriocin n=1 Tax=Virgibacillus xinjiangensis TaxID=393090 RepID=A0ABV7CSP7_9BACI